MSREVARLAGHLKDLMDDASSEDGVYPVPIVTASTLRALVRMSEIARSVPGVHRMEAVINGRAVALGEFVLLAGSLHCALCKFPSSQGNPISKTRSPRPACGERVRERGGNQAALANSSITCFSCAASFCALARCCIRARCAWQFLNGDRSSLNEIARRKHQKKYASGAVK